MGQRIVQVDAFTETPFAGNPAAVCVLEKARGETWMRHVAREMNLSETAFLLAEDAGYRLRWFTPTREVELCGHATLASAHVLWEEGHLGPAEQARFETLSGPLSARLRDDWIEMDFPSTPAAEAKSPPGLIDALGVEVRWVGKSRFDYLVELESEAALRDLQPDVGRLDAHGSRGVIVTACSESPRYDFVSRYFAPAYGIPEDPVTGSAHCCLGPFWSARLGRQELVGYQASSRGGIVRVRTVDDHVFLGGQAVTVLRGELL